MHCLVNIEYKETDTGELQSQVGLNFDLDIAIELKTHQYSGSTQRFYVYINTPKKSEYFQIYGDEITKLTLWFYKHKKPIVMINDDGMTGKLSEKEFTLKIYNQFLELQKEHIMGWLGDG